MGQIYTCALSQTLSGCYHQQTTLTDDTFVSYINRSQTARILQGTLTTDEFPCRKAGSDRWRNTETVILAVRRGPACLIFQDRDVGWNCASIRTNVHPMITHRPCLYLDVLRHHQAGMIGEIDLHALTKHERGSSLYAYENEVIGCNPLRESVTRKSGCLSGA